MPEQKSIHRFVDYYLTDINREPLVESGIKCLIADYIAYQSLWAELVHNWTKYNHFDMLGVATYASPAQIKGAYRATQRVVHPNSSIVIKYHKKDMSLVNDIASAVCEAYETLLNPKMRQEYTAKIVAEWAQCTGPFCNKWNHIANTWNIMCHCGCACSIHEVESIDWKRCESIFQVWDPYLRSRPTDLSRSTMLYKIFIHVQTLKKENNRLRRQCHMEAEPSRR